MSQSNEAGIFAGVVAYVQLVYVHLNDDPYYTTRSRDILTLKNNGAIITTSPTQRQTTHIICSHPTPTVPTLLYPDWDAPRPSVAELVSMDALCMYPRKTIVRRDFIDDCLWRGTLLGAEEDWGGWFIRGTGSPASGSASSESLIGPDAKVDAGRQLEITIPSATQCRQGSLPMPSHASHDLSSARRIASAPLASQRDYTMPSRTRYRSDSFGQTQVFCSKPAHDLTITHPLANPFRHTGPRLHRLGRVGGPDARDGEFRRSAGYQTTATAPTTAPSETDLSQASAAAAASSTSGEEIGETPPFLTLKDAAAVAGLVLSALPSPAVETTAAIKIAESPYKVFEAKGSALLIHIDDGLAMKPSLSAVIERLGGGKLVGVAVATHILLAVHVSAAVDDATAKKIEQWIVEVPSRKVLSFEWAIECLAQRRLVDEDEYRLCQNANSARARDAAVPATQDTSAVPSYDLSREDLEHFLRIFRIASCTSDLISALRVVANSIGKESLEWWQAYYAANHNMIQRRLADKNTALSQQQTSKRKRHVSSGSPDTSDSDSSTAESDCKNKRRSRYASTRVTVVPHQRESTSSLGSTADSSFEPTLESKIQAMLKEVHDVHLQRVQELIQRMTKWDRDHTLTQFLTALPRTTEQPQFATVFWKYRKLFRLIEKGPTIPKTPSRPTTSESRRVSRERTPSGKCYFTRSNLSGPAKQVDQQEQPRSESPETSPEPPKRAPKPTGPRPLTEIEANDYKLYAARFSHRSPQQIAQGYTQQSTASLREVDKYWAWSTRNGLFGPSQFAFVKANSKQWRSTATCQGCKGRSSDLARRGERTLCVDCRVDWDRGGTETQRKRGLKTRRTKVAAWTRELGLEG